MIQILAPIVGAIIDKVADKAGNWADGRRVEADLKKQGALEVENANLKAKESYRVERREKVRRIKERVRNMSHGERLEYLRQKYTEPGSNGSS